MIVQLAQHFMHVFFQLKFQSDLKWTETIENLLVGTEPNMGNALVNGEALSYLENAWFIRFLNMKSSDFGFFRL